MIDDAVQCAMRERGFGRHAVLLNTRYSQIYFTLLSHPEYRDSVIDAFGKEIYSEVAANFHTENQKATLLLFELLRANLGEDQPTSYSVPFDSIPPLQVTIERPFDEAEFRKAQVLEERLCHLINEETRMIYKEAKREIGKDAERLYAIYKDNDNIPEIVTEETIRKERKDYRRMLERRASNLERVVKESIINVDAGIKVNAKIAYRLLRAFLPLYNQRADPEVLIQYAIQTMNNPAKCERNFQKYLKKRIETKRKRVIASGRDTLNSFLSKYYMFERSVLSDDAIFYILSDENNKRDENLIDDAVSALFSSSTYIRREFLDFFEYQFSSYTRTIHGMEQLLSGGQCVNNDADPESVVQNDARFPNIHYSQTLLKKIDAIVREARGIVDAFPDISDLIQSTKGRKPRTISYTIEELLKDPLDITFGNDAGCCIFVPEKVEDIHNGIFVPIYLAHPGIHLFATYKQDRNRKQRMGLVLAFDGFTEKKEENILICNSLELSRLGIAGGKATINALTAYEEAWLGKYAQVKGYSGVAMGNHDYNTSINYSGRNSDIVTEKLCFDLGFLPPFYSDVFTIQKQKNQRIATTRERGCYWIWRAR